MRAQLMRAVQVAAGVAWVLTAAVASAQTVSVGGEGVESERTSMFELKLGSYTPRIDSEPGLTDTPFADTFKGGILLFELEYDWQFFQGFGSAALGFSAGYGEKFGPAKAAATGAEAGRTGFRVFPLKVLGVYRFDWLANEYRIPVVPYGKLGLVGIPWSIVKGSDIEVAPDGSKALGLKYGYEGVLGLALQLDFLSPRMARDFDASSGVNHSYAFAEATWMSADSFGKPGFDLGDRYLTFGLGLEF